MKNLHVIFIAFIILISIYYRTINYGFSNFQGDEASVVLASSHSEFAKVKDYIKSQSKGPGQYLVAYLISISNINFPLEAKIRLPFITVSLISIIFFTLTIAKIGGESPLYEALYFIFLSGLIICLSRIVQYQAFVILGISINLYLYVSYLKNRKILYLYLISLITIISLIFHYDILSIYIPIVIHLALSKKFKECFILIAPVFLVTFSIGFYLYDAKHLFNTFNYLTFSRVGGDFKYDSIYYSYKLLNIYNPLEYTFFLHLGVIIYILMQLKDSGRNNFFLFVSSLWARGLAQWKNMIFYTISLIFATTTFVKLRQIKNKNVVKEFILIWALLAYGFYFVLMTKPLTHIYSAIIPMSLLSAFGYKYLNKYLRACIFTFLIISSASFNYQIFSDINSSYPYTKRTYVFGRMNGLNSESLDGLFGFLYNRDLNEINTFLISRNQHIENIDSNEKEKITRLYFKDFKRSREKPFYYINILLPQSFIQGDTSSGQLILKKDRYEIYENY